MVGIKIKKKVISTFAALACLMTGTGFATTVAAAEKVPMPAESKVYYGQEITLENLKNYTQKDVTVGACDLFTPFLEFCITPSQTGTAEDYTPDFERLNVEFSSPTDPAKKMSLSIYQHYLVSRATDMSEKHIAVNVAGGEQSLAAEWRGTQEKNKNVLGTGYGGNIAQSFDGYVHASSYIDEDGNAVAKGSNRAIRLYYDMTENAMYTDVGRMNEYTQTTTDGAAKHDGNKYRWRIRDFDKADYVNSEGKTVETVWAGFAVGEELKYSVSFDKVAEGKQPSILLSKLMGETTLENPIVISSPSKGMTNVAYPVPQPIFYDEASYSEKTFAEVGGSYQIEYREASGDKTVVRNYTDFVAGASFTPTQAGEYILTYQVGGASKWIYVTVEDNPTEVSILPNRLPDSCYVDTTFDVGATCNHPSQSDAPTVYLEVFKDGSPYAAKEVVGQSFEFNFAEAGKYELVYTCEDYLGRQTTVKQNMHVQRYYVHWAEGLKENVAVPVGTAVATPSEADVKIFDIIFDQTMELQSCRIFVSYNGGAYGEVAAQNFSACGEYTVKYEIEYAAYGVQKVEVLRKIFVYETFFSSIEQKGVPVGTKLAAEISNPVEINLKAVTGKQIVIPYAYFGQAFTNVTLTDNAGAAQEIGERLAKGDFAFTPQSKGIYEVVAIAENDAYRAVKVLRIDVRDKWVTFSNVENLTLPLGTKIDKYLPVCKDFYGNTITEYAVEAYYMGEKVNGGDKLDKLGVYELVYTYSSDGEQAQARRKVTTVDVVQPTLKLDIPTKEGSAQSAIALAKCVANDDSGLPPQLLVTVTKDGKNVNVYNDSFYAEEQGEYVVTYYATDSQGNSVTAQYVVTVGEAKGGCGGCNGAAPLASVGVAIVLSGATWFSMKKKNKKDLQIKIKQK